MRDSVVTLVLTLLAVVLPILAAFVFAVLLLVIILLLISVTFLPVCLFLAILTFGLNSVSVFIVLALLLLIVVFSFLLAVIFDLFTLGGVMLRRRNVETFPWVVELFKFALRSETNALENGGYDCVKYCLPLP